MFYPRCLFLTLLLLSSTLCANPTLSKGAVLVTGGAGYIGTQTCKALHQAHYLPIAYDHVLPHNNAFPWGVLEQGDIHDKARLSAVIDRYQPIAVIHLAALKSVGDSVADPETYYHNNVVGSLALFSVLREKGIRRIIFSSSATLYGNAAPNTPLREDALIEPINPYGMTKWVVEKILQDFHDAYGWEYVVFRYFNAAGADLDGECGEQRAQPLNLVPLVLQVAEKKRPSLHLFGTDYPTEDGSCTRDFIHVVDVAEAHVKAVEYLVKGAPSLCFNLGSGKPTSVRQVVDMARKVTKRPIAVVETARRVGDPPYLVADWSLAKRLLNWEPKHSDLETIVATEWRWKLKQESDDADADKDHLHHGTCCQSVRDDPQADRCGDERRAPQL